MAKRKPRRPRKPPKKTTKKTKQHFIRAFTGVSILAALVFIAAVVVHYHRVQKSTVRPITQTQKKTPAPEIKPKKKIPPKKSIVKPKSPTPSTPKKRPRVAIIIDDLGYDKKLSEKFISLSPRITLSILPHSPFRKMILRSARSKGIETMLHLPMEPEEYPRVDPGPGALLTTMSPNELIDQLNRNLNLLPSVKGVNNHMGSKMTGMSTQMYQIFSVLKKRNLYFVDSKTSPDSLCRPSARLLRIPFGKRDVFLDNSLDPDKIRKQINELIRIAVAHGEAIGIGHPHDVTYETLRNELSRIKQKVRLVPTSKVVHLVG